VDLPVLALAEHDAQGRDVALRRDAVHLRGPRRPAVDLDAPAPALEVRVGDNARHFGDVDLRRFLARVQEPEREVAVVREEQRPRRAEIEPPDRHDAGPRSLQVVGYRGPALRIGHRAHDVARLVEDEVHEWFAADRTSVDLDAAPGLVRSSA
jgi:hypothetical protein